MLSKTRVVNVESQLTTEGVVESHLTTEGINVLLSDGDGGSGDDNGSSGDNSKDPEWFDDNAGGIEVGGGVASVELPLITPRIRTMSTSVPLIYGASPHQRCQPHRR